MSYYGLSYFSLLDCQHVKGSSFSKFLCHLFYFLVVLGLCCYAWAFSTCGEWGVLYVEVPGLLIAVASPVVEHNSRAQASAAVACWVQ